MPRVEPAEGMSFEAHAPVLVIGAGAAGLVAALRVRALGAEVLVLERDAVPRGSTALSAGLIPAGGTRFQRTAGIEDSPALFAADIMAKAHGEPTPSAVARVAETIGPALEWLADTHGLPFSVVENFTYPGHSARRMHGLPTRSGAELIDRLRQAAEAAGVAIINEATANTLFAAADGRIAGVGITRPDGSTDRIGCDALVLACNGYGGNKALVAQHIPGLADALYFGHAGNQGDALLWGEALGAAARDLPGHQGHGSVAHPHGILITWATITEGGIQVDTQGRRFHNEARGYSEAAAEVIAAPGGIAWTIFDARIAGIARQFEDFRAAEAAGAILAADTIEDLAARTRLPVEALAASLAEADALRAHAGRDRFGRDFAGLPPLAPPLAAVKVTGALFHTQGGLVVDGQARVLRCDGTAFPNLLAAGGAAGGLSGARAEGYLSGNGLLTAVAYGFLAGAVAAELAAERASAGESPRPA